MVRNLNPVLQFDIKLAFYHMFVSVVLGIIVIDSKLAVISLGSMYFCLLPPSLCFLCLLFLCECVCMIVFLSKLVLLILLSLGKKIDLPVVCQYLQCMLSQSCSFILIHMYSPVSHSYRIV